MAKKITLNDLAAMLTKQGKEIKDLTESVGHVVKHMATKEDIADIRREMATKEQLAALHTQVNSIEAELKHGRYETRLGNLETKVFGAPRR
jgi:hypothetical protein